MADNQKIMRNTFFLALRMPIVFAVNLFMSRVVLQELGTEDFGVYQVVASFVLLIAFVNGALISSIQRFFNLEMTRGEGQDLQMVFSAACKCLFLFCAAFLIFGETIGVWMWTKLDIPAAKHGVAMLVYQLALLTAVIEMFRSPYFAMLVAHEKMQFYTYHTLADAFMKLCVAFSLFMIHDNKLAAYAWMLTGIAVILNIILVVYCRWQFKDIRFSLDAPMRRTLEVTKFVGWTSLTSVSHIISQQGGSMILNVFFGVTLNATMGIVNQVKSGIVVLSRNLMLASSPQIIKSYGGNNRFEFESLMMRTTRILFFVVMFFGLPVMLNSGFILDVWLTEIPPYTSQFLRWMVVVAMVDTMCWPLETGMYACGRLGRYQITLLVGWSLSLGVLYVLYYLGFAPVWIIIIQAITTVLMVVIRVWFVHLYCDLSIKMYLRQAVVPIVLTLVIAAAPPTAVACVMQPGVARFFASSSVSVATCIFSILYLGFKPNERAKIINKVKKILHLS